MDTIKYNLCPVCGYELCFTPWMGKSPADEMCPCCGIQFGYDDWSEGDLGLAVDCGGPSIVRVGPVGLAVRRSTWISGKG